MTISALAGEVSGDIIFMQSLLDGDDGTSLFVIETAEQGLVDKPLRLGPRFRIGCVLRLHQIIDDDQVGPDTGHCAAHGGGKAIAALAGAKVGFGIADDGGGGLWKDLAIPARLDHLAKTARQGG